MASVKEMTTKSGERFYRIAYREDTGKRRSRRAGMCRTDGAKEASKTP